MNPINIFQMIKAGPQQFIQQMMGNNQLMSNPMSMYKDMTSILKDGQVGDFKLQHYEISDNNFYAIVRCGIPSGIYVRLGRLTEPSNGKRFEWREMIEEVKKLGRPLKEEETKKFRIK